MASFFSTNSCVVYTEEQRLVCLTKNKNYLCKMDCDVERWDFCPYCGFHIVYFTQTGKTNVKIEKAVSPD
jgi:hypothetical protein